MREVPNDHARFTRAKWVKLFEKFLAIIKRAHRIEHKNIVERAAECCDRREAFDHSRPFETLDHARNGWWLDAKLLGERGLADSRLIPHSHQQQVLSRMQSVRRE